MASGNGAFEVGEEHRVGSIPTHHHGPRTKAKKGGEKYAATQRENGTEASETPIHNHHHHHAREAAVAVAAKLPEGGVGGTARASREERGDDTAAPRMRRQQKIQPGPGRCSPPRRRRDLRAVRDRTSW